MYLFLTLNLLLYLVLNSNMLNAQTISIEWNEKLRKEVQVSCDSDINFCEQLCKLPDRCTFEEGFCRGCIGTDLKMYMILTEIGKSIVSSSVAVESPYLVDLFKNGHYATLSSNDAYNILDSFGSVRTFRKFEALCPPESLNQVLFLETHPITREILRPKFVYCEFQEGSSFTFLKLLPNIVVNDKRFMRVF